MGSQLYYFQKYFRDTKNWHRQIFTTYYFLSLYTLKDECPTILCLASHFGNHRHHRMFPFSMQDDRFSWSLHYSIDDHVCYSMASVNSLLSNFFLSFLVCSSRALKRHRCLYQDLSQIFNRYIFLLGPIIKLLLFYNSWIFVS